MLRFTKCIFAVLILCNTSYAQQTGSWGDQGNGTYINPVLNADYSDPDVIRVGKKYYMVCSEFHFMGMTIQESEDMVNWKIIGRIYNKIEGPRSPLLHIKEVALWEDPCPFWDDDGKAIAELNTVDLINGQKAGLTSISGNRFISIGVLKRDGKLFLFFEEKNDIIEELPISKKKVYLKFNIDTESSNNRFYYSFDNNNYYPLGNQFEISWGAWKGSRIGLFSYNVIAEGGTAYFDNFHYNYDGPK